jgi:hypothetical protein
MGGLLVTRRCVYLNVAKGGSHQETA